jgi:methylthioribulose 1-phosphate dehydratase/enolase-phosphatase E1
MAAAIPLNGVKLGTTSSQAYLEGKAVKETKALMAELCRHFYTLGWVSGTGGSISIKVHDDSIPKPQQLILMSPSGILPYHFQIVFYNIYFNYSFFYLFIVNCP